MSAPLLVLRSDRHFGPRPNPHPLHSRSGYRDAIPRRCGPAKVYAARSSRPLPVIRHRASGTE
eukprot:3922125-Pyramimonas_sp.AAC.1